MKVLFRMTISVNFTSFNSYILKKHTGMQFSMSAVSVCCKQWPFKSYSVRAFCVCLLSYCEEEAKVVVMSSSELSSRSSGAGGISTLMSTLPTRMEDLTIRGGMTE